MEFSQKVYELRKSKGLSQEELAARLNVSRQTVSKWELGVSTPDMEKLVSLGDFFELSLDELVLDKKENVLKQRERGINITEEHKSMMKKGVKIAGIVLGSILVIDIISMIIYIIFYGIPK